jgi:hypothetical protein
MKKLFFLTFLLAFVCHSSQAQVYRCIDEAGNEVYNQKGGPNCTLLYPSRHKIVPNAGGPAGTPTPTKEESMTTPEGGSLTFVENTSDVIGEQVRAKGKVRNNGPHVLRSVQIVVECYDEEDELLATASSHTEPQHIPPGGTAAYEITVPHNKSVKTVKTLARWMEQQE